MKTDYYETLGVADTASQAEIKQAYRRMAMKCHPDRGGSHERMLAINEAFEVLKNPALRAEYDYARTHRHDSSAQQAAERTARTARADAQNYPRDWSAFEKWLNGISDDFRQAEYGSTKSGPIPFPTAKKSVSGCLFIFIGAGAGLFVSILLAPSVGHSSSRMTAYMLLVPVALGAWVGRGVHSLVRGAITPSASRSQPQQPDIGKPPPTPATEATTILPCPNCTQQLRIPLVDRQIRIKCTTCGHLFTNAPEQRFCPACGNKLETGNRYCARCGAVP